METSHESRHYKAQRLRTEVKLDGIEYLIMKESDLMGVLGKSLESPAHVEQKYPPILCSMQRYVNTEIARFGSSETERTEGVVTFR